MAHGIEGLPKWRCLSLRQPWAEQVMRGEKPVEYRGRNTRIRGRIYIYASLGKYSKEDTKVVEEDAGFPSADLPRGVVVGSVELYDCGPSRQYPGEFEWLLRKPERLEELHQPIMKPQPVWFYPFGHEE